jgi:hypothetical protein
MKNKHFIWTIIMFGAIWGILEATLGHVLQFLPPYVSGAVMFPIAASLLIIAHKNTMSLSSLIWIGLIAASLKAVNFLMPGLPAVKTYNPMIAIILQSAVMVGAIGISSKVTMPEKFAVMMGASVLWRGLFVANVTVNNMITGFGFPQIASTGATLSFVIIDGLIAGVLLAAGVYGLEVLFKKWNPVFRIGPALAVPMFVIAGVLTWFF